MDSDEAISLLLKAAGEENDSSRDRANPVVQLLGHIPLAIIHAGAAIRHKLYTYEGYCEEFMHRRKDLLNYKNVQVTNYERSIYATWEMSVDAIRKIAEGGVGVSKVESDNAANALDLLNVFGFWHFGDISEEIMQMVWEAVPRFEDDPWWMSNVIRLLRENRSPKWDPLPFRKSVDTLSSYSLINGTNGQISLHPLVQSCIRDLLESKSNIQWWTTALIMLAMATKSLYEGEVQRQRLLGPHLYACLTIRNIEDFFIADDAATDRIQAIGLLLLYDSTGVLSEVLFSLAQRSLEYGDKMLDENDPMLWKLLESTACRAGNLGMWQTIVDLLEAKVTSILDTRTLMSEYSIQKFWAMGRLIRAYFVLDRTQEALEIAEKVIELSKKSLDEDNVTTAETEEHLARIYNELGRKDDSIIMMRIAYSKMEAALGEDHPRCVKSKSHLAGIYCTIDPQKAFDLYQQVRDLFSWARKQCRIDLKRRIQYYPSYKCPEILSSRVMPN